MDANRRKDSAIRSMGERGRLDRRVRRPAEHIPFLILPSGAGRETRHAATKMVALPKIRDDLRPCAVAVGLPRNILSLNVMHTYSSTHARNLTISAQNRKTYGRLLGMIFFGGVGSTLVAEMQRLATTTISEEPKKRTAKHQIFSLGPPFFCQNALKKARFLCQY
jgi:hypothetical protein